MGATNDSIHLPGDLDRATVTKKFHDYVEECQHDYGHSGYTGTMAEARGLVFTGKVFDSFSAANDYLDGGNNEDGEWVEGHCEKWGPALAVRVEMEDKQRWVISDLCSE